MDRQAREMDQKLENATVERVGEGILVTFKSGLLFDHNSYALRSETRANLQEMAGILQEYKDTELVIDGHTDATGSESYNQTLSERRAGAVSDYLASQGVARSRLSVHGYGEMKPVETNETESGRQANRRVEVAIIANDQLKRDAQDGAIGN
jgi:outer membrane protein OmpA-like peptidoglycan-associated protein